MQVAYWMISVRTEKGTKGADRRFVMNALKKIKLCTVIEICAAGFLFLYYLIGGSDYGGGTGVHWYRSPLFLMIGFGTYQLHDIHKFRKSKERKTYFAGFMVAIVMILARYFALDFPDQKIWLLFSAYVIGAEIYKYRKFSRPETFL